MMPSSSAAASGAMAPERVSAARSWVAGRSTRSDRQVPPAAIGGSTACNRTLNWPVPRPVNWPSTQGCASSRRRPADSARRCASRRTAASSANRIELRRKPFPSSIHTASGAVTSTSVVPSAHSSGSRMPAPVSSVCSTRKLLSTSLSPSTPPDSARIAAATTLGRSGPDSAASRSRTRSISEALMRPPRDAGAAPRAHVAPRLPAAIAHAVATRRARAHRRHPAGRASRPAAAVPRSRATSADLRPPGDGPRTTTPALGLADDTHGVIAAAAAHERTSAGAITTTRSATSSTSSTAPCGSPGKITDHGRAAAAAGVEDRAQRSGVDVAAGATTRQHADPVSLRQCVPQRGIAQPTALQRQVRPAQSRSRLRSPEPDQCHHPTGPRRPAAHRRAVCANAVAKTEAPAPPRPAITPTTAPRRSSSRHASAALDISAINSPSCAGSVMTCCAPTAMAAWKSAASGSERERQARRGHAAAAHGARSDGRPPHRAIRPRRQSMHCGRTGRSRGRPAIRRPRRHGRHRLAARGRRPATGSRWLRS